MDNEIEFWQQSVVPDDGCEALAHKHEGFASHLTKAACELFRLLLEQDRLETTRSDYRALSRVFGYLQLWCDGYGAPSGDLDVVLSESKRLRHDTYRLLVSICNTLADRLPTVLSTGSDDDWQRRLDKQVARTRDLIEEAAFVHGSDDGSDSASDSGSDASSSSNNSTIDNIVKDLETDIHCLVDLGPRYNEPIRDRTVKEQPASPSLTVDWDPAEHLASRIRHRYPNGDTAVTQILGHVNWERAKRLYASREANARAAERPALQLGPVPEAKGTAIASEAKGRVTASGFQDSGLGSTSPSPSLCPETLLSYRDVKGGSIGIPQVPPEGMKGEPFICGICGCSCQLPKASWKSSWK
ncbi:uncharacterized protein B0H64DRAFT_377880 [Chaetomium fimeti]|uniref:Uncharacterized protein n=1 Tax=Chaetomium fimeti TaxID=1854472 RepID=A0AAE0H704_9PEZI|nr:hypothetical protein B0H64DRAFT_377880 [Chaetomium fimeti]